VRSLSGEEGWYLRSRAATPCLHAADAFPPGGLVHVQPGLSGWGGGGRQGIDGVKRGEQCFRAPELFKHLQALSTEQVSRSQYVADGATSAAALR